MTRTHVFPISWVLLLDYVVVVMKVGEGTVAAFVRSCIRPEKGRNVGHSLWQDLRLLFFKAHGPIPMTRWFHAFLHWIA